MTSNGSDGGQDSLVPPYISYATFVTCLDWLKEMPVIPSQLDRSLWAGKFAGSTGSQLMSGLKFLRLLDSKNTPLPRLAELAQAGANDRKALMREILKESYGADLVDNLATKTPKMVDEALEYLGTTDGTHRKAVSFFVNGAKVNDLQVPSAIAKKARVKASKTRGRRQTAANGSRESGENNAKADPSKAPTTAPKHQEGSTKTVALRSGGTVSVSVSVNLLELSPDDRNWVFEVIDKLQEYERKEVAAK